MQLLALLAPFGAVFITLLLAIGVCYATVYTRLCLCFESGRRGCVAVAQSVVQSVDMLGTHIEDESGEAYRWWSHLSVCCLNGPVAGPSTIVQTIDRTSTHKLNASTACSS
jgi:hypothetical protein